MGRTGSADLALGGRVLRPVGLFGAAKSRRSCALAGLQDRLHAWDFMFVVTHESASAHISTHTYDRTRTHYPPPKRSVPATLSDALHLHLTLSHLPPPRPCRTRPASWTPYPPAAASTRSWCCTSQTTPRRRRCVRQYGTRVRHSVKQARVTLLFNRGSTCTPSGGELN